jgi:bifunctional enzyme Fae/Hps
MLDDRKRYLQIAFNNDVGMVRQILPRIVKSDRILIEAGTPFMKREGLAGLRAIRMFWSGSIVADIKITDGAEEEVAMVRSAGATAVTAVGSAPIATLKLFVETCQKLGMVSMIDMLGVADPLRVITKIRTAPDVVVLHRGRDEESIRGIVIQYRHVNRLRSKYPVLISAAGGVDLKEARSAIFNGANIVVANLVRPGDPWTGIRTDTDVGAMSRQFLETIE